MNKAKIEVVLMKNEIVTTSGGCDADCYCFELGVMNPDTTNDDC